MVKSSIQAIDYYLMRKIGKKSEEWNPELKVSRSIDRLIHSFVIRQFYVNARARARVFYLQNTERNSLEVRTL